MRVLLLIALLPWSMYTQGQSKSFKVEGKISGWKDKEQVALFYRSGENFLSDTAEVIKGRFVFAGKIDAAVEATVSHISGQNKGLRDLRPFYLRAGKISIKGTDSLKTAKVTGAGATSEFEERHAKIAPLMERLWQIRLKGMTMGKLQEDSPEYKSLVQGNLDVINAIYDAEKAFIFKYPSSVVSLNILVNMTQGVFNVDKTEPLYTALSAPVQKSPDGVAVGKLILMAKTTRIGAVLPDFSSKDTLGKSLTLNEVVMKGKVTLVDFWASWCKPCREENPNVVKAFKAFHDKGFNILSVSLDQNAASWKKAIEKDGMPWYHVSSLKYWDEPIVKQFGITGVPDSFLLDAEGKIIARGLRGDALYKKIEETLY